MGLLRFGSVPLQALSRFACLQRSASFALGAKQVCLSPFGFSPSGPAALLSAAQRFFLTSSG